MSNPQVVLYVAAMIVLLVGAIIDPPRFSVTQMYRAGTGVGYRSAVVQCFANLIISARKENSPCQ